MILYLRVHVIFWMIVTESSSYVLINVFPNNVTSVLDGDLPTEVAPPVRACTVSDSCSNNAARRRFVSSRLLLLQTDQLSASCRKGKKNQPKCTWRVYCRLKQTSSSAFPISEGSNVNPPPSSFLSFHLTQLLTLFFFFFLALIFMLLFSVLISTFSQVPLFLCFHTVCTHNELDLCARAAHVSFSFDAAQFWGRSELMKMGRFVLPCPNWTLLLLGPWLTERCE